uniref:Protein F37C4.5 n=1 Tax=Panagrolaimus sp. PS1159 TaxID=55785 RepID=A0AC35GLQ3_9BILA
MVTQNSLQILKASEVPITSVTIFNNTSESSNLFASNNKRAEVTRIFNVSLKPGINEIHLEDIAKTIVPNSISVIGQGHATILDVSLQTKKVAASEEEKKKGQKLEAELKEYEIKIAAEKDFFDVQNAKLSALKVLLNRYTDDKKDVCSFKENEYGFNKTVGTNIMELLGFYEKNAGEINTKIRECQERGKTLEDKVQAIKAQKTLLTTSNSTMSYISIKIDSETEKEKEEAELTLIYHVTDASWIPFYDIRVDTKTYLSQVTIYYYASVEQETGENWKNIELSLSTAQPCNNDTLPKLGTTVVEFIQQMNNGVHHSGPLFLGNTQSHASSGTVLFGIPHGAKPAGGGSLFGAPSRQPQQQLSQGLFGSTQPTAGTGLFGNTQPAAPPSPPPPPMKNVISVAEKEILSTTFTVPRKSTIPSDSSKHKVIIGIEKVVANIHHECVPSKDKKVYLMASVTNTIGYPLLSGFATVFIDNSLSTTFILKTVSPGEKFDCALGVDKSVKVIYKPTIKTQTKLNSGVFSNYNSISNEQKIVVKNTKKSGSICITLYESIPKSTNERIKIRVTQPDPIKEKDSGKKKIDENEESKEEDDNGMPEIGPFLDEKHNLMWTENIQAEDEHEFIIKWADDYPVDEKIKFIEK